MALTNTPAGDGQATDTAAYLAQYNAYLEHQNQIRSEAATEQAIIENGAYIFILLLLLASPLLSLLYQKTGKVFAAKLLVWLPNIANLTIFAALNALGGWGQEKHPFMHSLIEGKTPFLATYWYCTVAASIVIYAISFKLAVVSRLETGLSFSLYLLVAVAFYVLALALSGLP